MFFSRKLAFQSSSPSPSVFFKHELPQITRELFVNYSCPAVSVLSERKFMKKFTDNLRFTFREATTELKSVPVFSASCQWARGICDSAALESLPQFVSFPLSVGFAQFLRCAAEKMRKYFVFLVEKQYLCIRFRKNDKIQSLSFHHSNNYEKTLHALGSFARPDDPTSPSARPHRPRPTRATSASRPTRLARRLS